LPTKGLQASSQTCRETQERKAEQLIRELRTPVLLSRFDLLPSDAQQGVHAFLLGLGVEQAWTDHTHAGHSPR
jgi:hypothetical protein